MSNTAVADHPDVRHNYPMLSRAILSGASQQIRNVASVGGNMLQRTRCSYYYDTAFACNKREPESGCPAATGVNRMHALLGASDQCVAVHPSDMCVAIAALDATVEVEGPQGKRQIPFTNFHQLPGTTPQRDISLELGELITAVVIPPMPFAKSGVYLKLRDRASYAFALISVTAADALGVPVEKVRVELGDSLLPDGGIVGGSRMTASLVPAVMTACQNLLKTANCTSASEACAALRQSRRAAFEATASSAPSTETKKWAFQSWGAHFCEVMVDEDIGRLRVTHWVSVMNIGRVMNAKTAASQVCGGVIMGIGHALMEEAPLDPNTGYPVVYDLATYHFPAHADTPLIDVTFVGEPDLNFNPSGARGVGEIGITGVSAAIANAVYHATGKRIRELPITPEKLL